MMNSSVSLNNGVGMVWGKLYQDGNYTCIATGVLVTEVIALGLRCNSQRGSTSRFHLIRDYNDSSKIGPKLKIGLSQNCLMNITREGGGWHSLK